MFIDIISLEIATSFLYSSALHIAKDVRVTRVKMTQVLQFQNARLYSNLPVPDEMKKERQDSEPFMKLQGIQFEGLF